MKAKFKEFAGGLRASARDPLAQRALLRPGDHHGRGLCVPGRDTEAQHGSL